MTSPARERLGSNPFRFAHGHVGEQGAGLTLHPPEPPQVFREVDPLSPPPQPDPLRLVA